MTDETVAKLGFEIGSEPLDTAKQRLDALTDAAKKAGVSVEELKKRMADASAGLGGAGQVTQNLDAIVSKTGVSYRAASAYVKDLTVAQAAASAATKELGAVSATAGSAIGTIAKEAGAIAPALNAVGAATRAVTVEHSAHNAAISSLRSNLRGMSPLLNQLGGGLGDVLQYARAARLGLEGLALVAGGGLLIALAKVGDEVDRTKNRLAGLTESAASGAKAYDAINAAAKASGGEFSVLEGVVEKLIIGQEKFADKNVIYANSADMAGKKAAEFAAAVGTVDTMLHANVATAEQAKTALNALGDSFAKDGKLTVEALTKIRDASPGTAKALADAFGFKSVKDFIAELEKGDLTLDQFVKRMALVAPQVAATFDPEKPKNFTQALEGLSHKWNEFVKDLAKKPEAIGAIDVLKEALVVLPKILDQDFKDITSFKQLFSDIGAEWSAYKDKVSTAWHNTEAVVETAVTKIISIIARLPGEGIAAITSWANSAIAEFNRMAQGAVSAAQQAVSALGSLAKGAGGAFNQSTNNANGGNDYGGPALSPDNSGGMTGGGYGGDPYSSGGYTGGGYTANIPSQGSDAGAPGFDLGMADLPAFAGGGQFTVAGSGGTDSQVVSFKSTPGEVVTVSTPEQMAQSGAIQGITTAQGNQATTPVGVVSATPEPAALATVKEITDAIDQSTIDISKKVSEGSDNIVSALNKLTGAASAPVVDSSTGLPVSTLASRGSLSGQGGATLASLAARGGGGFTVKGGASPKTEIDKYNDAQHAKDNAAYAAYQQAQGQADARFQSAYGSIFGQGGSVRGGRSGGISGRPVGQFAPISNNYGGYQPLDPNTFDYLNQSGYASVGSATTSAFNDYGLDYGGNTGGDFGYGGSTTSDVASQYMSSGGGDYTSGGFGNDTGAIDYGGGSVDAGYFATGGSFTVPGSSGVDKTLVSMHATPGETVTVTPLSSNVATANADPSSQANITNKTVNIHVQAGIQAESFIRSRAMIARGF